ncbi:hypothetical protein [Clostridium thermarum]|uniref:hypothetical protein n=1 Tax=Clostridium thermarum TaxID=1716543 RepID=UPI0013D629F5|nr:hypothetical protein [Clostridium thermarum]
MIYKSGKLGCYEAYDYVKAMLSKIGKVKEFKAFYEDTEPYFEIEDGRKNYYHFILIDDNENEFWIDTNCGYGGTGPSFTEKILQLVGARENYKIDKKRVIHEKDLELNHDLNALVVLHDYSNLKEKYKILFMIEAKFSNAASRFKVVDALEKLGDLHPHILQDERFNSYFRDYDYVDNSLGQYKVNNILFLSRYLKNISIEDLKEILNTIAVRICGDAVEINFIDLNAEHIEE